MSKDEIREILTKWAIDLYDNRGCQLIDYWDLERLVDELFKKKI